VLTEAYISELNKNGKIDHAIAIIKRLLNNLIGYTAGEVFF